MGFLDSILKKKGAEGEEAEAPVVEQAPVGPKPNPLAKLKGVLNHLEKIILGLVIVGVAALSVKQLLDAKKDMSVIDEESTDVQLMGRMLNLAEERPSNLIDLVNKALEKPDAINLEGTNHLVFNPRVWKEIFMTNTGEALLVMDSPNEPLGISALRVTGITTNKAYLKARAFIGGGFVRHEFTWVDQDYPAQPYAMMRLAPQMAPLRTFLPQQPLSRLGMAPLLSARQTGWTPSTNSPARPLHGFMGNNAYWLRFNPEFELMVAFKKFSPATPAQLGAARQSPAQTIPGVVYEMDVIQGTKGGVYPYETNSVRAVSDVPIEYIRGYVASFAYETKYHKKLELAGFREGRRLMIDGEVFRVFRITGDAVSLVSDPEYGGNGKIYDKPLQRGAPPVGP